MIDTNRLLEFIEDINKQGFVRIVPSTDLDSLLASGVLLKILVDNGVDAVLNMDLKTIIDERDEPTLLINLPLNVDRRNIFNIVFDESSSTTAILIHTLDRVFKFSKWAKTLALIAGVYRWLDVGKEGFRGLEKHFLEELTGSNHVIKEAGFRLPGWRRISLARSIYRSLIPYVPGLTGSLDRVASLVKGVFGEVDIEKFQGSEVFDKKDTASINDFLRKIDQSLEHLGEETRRRVLYKLVGYVYYIDLNGFIVDFVEAVNALSLVLSIEKGNPIYVVMTGFNKEFFAEALYIYEELIEDRVSIIADAIEKYINGRSKVVVLEKGLERPELIVDILNSLGKLHADKVFYVSIGGEFLTTVSTLLKLGFKPEQIFASCDENQICRVTEDGGGLSKS